MLRMHHVVSGCFLGWWIKQKIWRLGQEGEMAIINKLAPKMLTNISQLINRNAILIALTPNNTTRRNAIKYKSISKTHELFTSSKKRPISQFKEWLGSVNEARQAFISRNVGSIQDVFTSYGSM